MRREGGKIDCGEERKGKGKCGVREEKGEGRRKKRRMGHVR